MRTLTHKVASEGQIKTIARFAGDAAEKAVKDFTGLSKEGAELVKGDAYFTARIREATTAILKDLSITNRYKKEEVKPRWPYPASYKCNTIERQIDILRSAENFPFLNPDAAIKYYCEVYATLPQPEWVEGPFIIIPTTAFKKHCFHDADGAELLCNAVNLGIEKLGASGSFYNWYAGEITTDRFRRKARYVPMYERLYATQPNSDLIIVGGQYGKFHGGQSMRRALERMRGQVSECPAGALEGVVMALANPTRYSKWDELETDFPADEFRPDEEDEFSLSPFLNFNDDVLGFRMGGADYTDGYYGSVSLSVPQA